MAALSPAQANEVVFWLLVLLVALLALSLAAVIASPARAASPPAEQVGAEPGPSGQEPRVSALPRRVAGQSGAGDPASDPARPPGAIRPPRASDRPPWGPAPRPPGVPPHVHYGGQVIDTSTGRAWRCPHNHPTPAVRDPLRGLHAGADQAARLGQGDGGALVATPRRARTRPGTSREARLSAAADSSRDVPGPPSRSGSEPACATRVPLVRPPRSGQYGRMGDRYRTPGGWTVEVVQLAAGNRLRIRHHGFYVADVLSVDDLARAARPEAVRHRSAGVCAPGAQPIGNAL